MLIIFVYATILFVYCILLKCHIPIHGSHQDSSEPPLGLVPWQPPSRASPTAKAPELEQL